MNLKTVKIIAISAAISVIVSVGMNYLPIEKIYSDVWWFSIIFHLLISVVLNIVLLGKKVSPEDFVNKIMFTSIGRLLVCMIGVFIYSLIDKAHFTGFAIHFMLHYLVFTILEIKSLLNHVKSKPNE